MENKNFRIQQVKNNCKGVLDNEVPSTSETVLLEVGHSFDTVTINGVCDSVGTATVLNLTDIDTLGLVVGDHIYNITKNTSAVVKTIDTDFIITTTLKGTNASKIWDNGDEFAVGIFEAQLQKREGGIETGTVTAFENILCYKIVGNTISTKIAWRGFGGTTAQDFTAGDFLRILSTEDLYKEMQNYLANLELNKSDIDDTVLKTGDQTIADIKTFSSPPKSSSPAVASDELVNFQQLLDNAGGNIQSIFTAGEDINEGELFRKGDSSAEGSEASGFIYTTDSSYPSLVPAANWNTYKVYLKIKTPNTGSVNLSRVNFKCRGVGYQFVYFRAKIFTVSGGSVGTQVGVSSDDFTIYVHPGTGTTCVFNASNLKNENLTSNTEYYLELSFTQAMSAGYALDFRGGSTTSNGIKVWNGSSYLSKDDLYTLAYFVEKFNEDVNKMYKTNTSLDHANNCLGVANENAVTDGTFSGVVGGMYEGWSGLTSQKFLNKSVNGGYVQYDNYNELNIARCIAPTKAILIMNHNNDN